MLRELSRGGPAQHRVGSDDDGGVPGAHAHAREQDVDVVVVLEVDPHVRQLRATGEGAEGERSAVEARADDLDRAGAFPCPEGLTPRHERPEDDVGELGLLAHELAELGDADAQHPSRPRDARHQVRPLPGEQAQLAEEPAVTVHGDEDVAGRVGAEDLDLTVQHDPEVVRLVGRAEQHVAGVDRALLAVREELGELSRTERGRARARVGLVVHRAQVSEVPISPRPAPGRPTCAASS